MSDIIKKAQQIIVEDKLAEYKKKEEYLVNKVKKVLLEIEEHKETIAQLEKKLETLNNARVEDVVLPKAVKSSTVSSDTFRCIGSMPSVTYTTSSNSGSYLSNR